MESLDLAYKLVNLKTKSIAPDQIYLCLKYFRNIVIVVTKKNKKMKIAKIYLYLLPPGLSSQDRGGGGFVATHLPPTFQFTAKSFEIFFHRYKGIWTKGG